MYLSQQRDQASFEGLSFTDCYWGELKEREAGPEAWALVLPWATSSFNRLKIKPAHPFGVQKVHSWFMRTHASEMCFCQITLTIQMLTRQDPWLCAASDALVLQTPGWCSEAVSKTLCFLPTEQQWCCKGYLNPDAESPKGLYPHGLGMQVGEFMLENFVFFRLVIRNRLPMTLRQVLSSLCIFFASAPSSLVI